MVENDICRASIENPFKATLLSDESIIGFWSALANPVLAEVAVDGTHFQWVLFDSEHAPNDVHTLIAQLQAIRFSGVPAVVRPVLNHPVEIKRLLDIGFRNLLIPSVQSAKEAHNAVLAARYPPAGIRGVSAYHRNNGYGGIGDYFEFIDDAIAIIAQIESVDAVERMDEIAAVEGIDALFVGPGDLAASLGYLGQVKAKAVQEAIRDIGQHAKSSGKRIGIAAGNMDDVARYREWGYSLFTVGSDAQLFRQAIENLSEAILNRR